MDLCLGSQSIVSYFPSWYMPEFTEDKLDEVLNEYSSRTSVLKVILFKNSINLRKAKKFFLRSVPPNKRQK